MPVHQDNIISLLEEAVSEVGLDAIELAHNFGEATLEQLHEIVDFAERLKQASLIEMYARQRAEEGEESPQLVPVPHGYAGYQPS